MPSYALCFELMADACLLLYSGTEHRLICLSIIIDRHQRRHISIVQYIKYTEQSSLTEIILLGKPFTFMIA